MHKVILVSVSSYCLEKKSEEFLKIANTIYLDLCILKDGVSGSRFQKQISEEAKKIYETYESRNCEKSKEACKKELDAQLHHFVNQLADRYSEPEGKGLQNLLDDIEKMKKKYNKKELGPAKETVLTKFENTEVNCSKVIK